ncbi:hypothetical protein DSO57_1000823 [Entomophthora muscae]|uniref:Uncharacterized protein n=1 Tax=Entomophthora muscae TaxID=34485 RepID=A0ACC2U733_9FUNG|nr:hypothetical protein DSO57_1000823 [Entomophthora muscae]
MLQGQNHTVRYCVEDTSNLFCPPVAIARFVSSNRTSLTSDASSRIQPPIAKKVPHFNTYHRQKYLDEYHWFKDDKRENKEVLDHLKAENKYSAALLSPLKPLEDEIYSEIVGRMAEDDFTYPETKGGYIYYKKTVKGLQYSVRCRKRIVGDSSAKEEVLLDLNKFKEKHLNLGIRSIAKPKASRIYPGYS